GKARQRFALITLQSIWVSEPPQISQCCARSDGVVDLGVWRVVAGAAVALGDGNVAAKDAEVRSLFADVGVVVGVLGAGTVLFEHYAVERLLKLVHASRSPGVALLHVFGGRFHFGDEIGNAGVGARHGMPPSCWSLRCASARLYSDHRLTLIGLRTQQGKSHVTGCPPRDVSRPLPDQVIDAGPANALGGNSPRPAVRAPSTT